MEYFKPTTLISCAHTVAQPWFEHIYIYIYIYEMLSRRFILSPALKWPMNEALITRIISSKANGDEYMDVADNYVCSKRLYKSVVDML